MVVNFVQTTPIYGPRLKTMRVQHMLTKAGNLAKNQFEVYDDKGRHFLSYGSHIATVTNGGTVKLFNPYWDMYSQTTNFYLLQFLNEPSIVNIREKVEGGEYLQC